jgi:hypothetical protein
MLNEIYNPIVKVYCTQWGSSVEGQLVHDEGDRLFVKIDEFRRPIVFYKTKTNTFVCNKAMMELVITL